MSTATSTAFTSRSYSTPDVPSEVVQRTMATRSENIARQSEPVPEHLLMVALLRDAVRRIEKYRGSRDVRGKQRFAREAEWMLCDDCLRLFSFGRICETLDLDPNAVRHSLGFAPAPQMARIFSTHERIRHL